VKIYLLKYTKILFVLLFFLLFNKSIVYAARGDLISAEIMSTRNLLNNQAFINNELSQIAGDMFSLDPVKYGYWLYKITYETVNIYNEPHFATGILSYPRVDFPDYPNEAFPVISYQHGTVVEKSSVSSVNGEWLLSAILTGAGYVYVEPDYLGLGDSKCRHPYQLKEPYGTAGIDLLRAVRNYAINENFQFMINDQLFLIGYSEGGYATMAMHQIIERDYSNEFNIMISFPMAGAYSMSGIMADLMISQVPYGEPFYFPYVLFSYLESYPNIGLAEEYLLPEYLFLEDMFDGYHSSVEINYSMPSIPISIMKPEEIENFESDFENPLRLALQENDIWDWEPLAPIHLFHGLGDELVPFENSQLAYDKFIENGSEEVMLELIPENFGSHAEVAPLALFGAYQVAANIMKVYVSGDLNQDTYLNILDLIVIANFILYSECGNNCEYTEWAADLNRDLIVNIQDIVELVNIILNI